MENRKFKCPKCGGAHWSALLKFIPDDAFPPLKTMAEVQAAHDADRGVIWGDNKNAAKELYELVLDHLDADIDIDP